MSAPEPSAYARAGVDIDAGERAVELIKTSVVRTRRPEVIGGLGGFAGLFDASALARFSHPVLATSTDGVGTKVAIAQALDVHDTIGHDLVGMLVDDLVVCGAEPLFVTDYIACGALVPERIAAIVAGIADACVLAGASLLGGETAEHPGLLEPDAYDVAGATTGVVERDRMLGSERVRAGDVLVAMASSGLHSNGYSLVRRVVADAGWELGRTVPEFSRTLGEELLEPTRIYARDCLALAEACDVHVMSHVTGGGLANNLARVLPESLSAVVERSSWSLPPVFSVLARLGGVSRPDAEATWNTGIGMVAVLPEDAVPTALATLAGRGVPSWVCGHVEDVPGGRVRLIGEHR